MNKNKYVYVRKRNNSYAVLVQYVDESGARKQKTIAKFDDKKKAEAKKIELLNEINKNRLNISSKTLVEAFSDYYNNSIRNLSNSTKRSYECTLNNYIKPYFGDIELNDLTIDKVNKFVSYIYSLNLKTNSRKTFLQRLMAVLTDAYKKQEINIDMARIININKRETKVKDNTLKEDNIYTAEEVAHILSILDFDSRVYRGLSLGIATLLLTGCRFGEMAGLKWEDINFETGEITIQHNLIYTSKIGYEIRPTKTYTARRFVISDRLLNLYKQELKRQKRFKLLGLFADKEFTDLVHLNSRLLPWNNTSFRRSYSYFCKRNNIKQIRIHDMRHTHASILLSEGVDLKTVAERLGHSNMDVTFKVYAHGMKEADQRAANILENM